MGGSQKEGGLKKVVASIKYTCRIGNGQYGVRADGLVEGLQTMGGGIQQFNKGFVFIFFRLQFEPL